MDGMTTAQERLNSDVSVSFPLIDIRKGDLLGNLKRFREVIRTLNPTTMLTHNFGSIEWAMANQLKLVRHIHVEDGFGPEERNLQLPRRVWLRRVALRNRPVVLPSRTLLEIAERVWRLRSQRLYYIPNGIDLARFAAVGKTPDWPGDTASGGPIIGTVAALRPEKNLGRLIRAFHFVASQASARLLIVGDGPERAELGQLTAGLGLSSRVHFAGHVVQPDDLIRSFDIFAMSSDTEQMPISLLEAMAAARPVAATDVGDIAMMLPEAGREFITPCDDLALGQALLKLVKSPDLRSSLGQASRQKTIQNFDQADMFRKWSALLEKGHL